MKYDKKMTENFTRNTPNTSLMLPPLYFPTNTLIEITVTVTNFLKNKYIYPMKIKTTMLPLPAITFNAPDVIETYINKVINLETYATLPTCNGIDDLGEYLGYKLDSLKYEWG